MYLVYMSLGLLIAVAASMAGIGGGVFTVPILLFLGYEPSTAIGTSKFIMVFQTLIAFTNYLRLGKLEWKKGFYMLLGMAPASFIGAYYSALLPSNVLETILGAFVIYYSIRLLYSSIKRMVSKEKTSYREEKVMIKIQPVKGMIIGVFSGLIAGLTGTGGGAVNMPIFIGILKFPVHSAVALSNFLIFFAAIPAAVAHIAMGVVLYPVAIPWIIGALAGAFIGSSLAIRMSREKLRLFIGIILLYIGLRMFLY